MTTDLWPRWLRSPLLLRSGWRTDLGFRVARRVHPDPAHLKHPRSFLFNSFSESDGDPKGSPQHAQLHVNSSLFLLCAEFLLVFQITQRKTFLRSLTELVNNRPLCPFSPTDPEGPGNPLDPGGPEGPGGPGGPTCPRSPFGPRCPGKPAGPASPGGPGGPGGPGSAGPPTEIKADIS